MATMSGEGKRKKDACQHYVEGYMELRNKPAPASLVSILGRCKSAGITTPEMVKGKVDHIDGPSAVGYSEYLDHLNKTPEVVGTYP